MPTHKDISCSIRVHHKTLQEYVGEDADQSSQPPTTKTVYIQAQESATFSIRCEVLPAYKPVIGNRLSFRVYIGGKVYCRRSIDIDTSEHEVLSLEGAEGVDHAGNVFVHPFQFAGVSLVEDHESNVRTDPDSLAKMGEISVYVVRTRRIPGSDRRRLEPRPAVELALVEKVNEKALKGRDFTHVTKLGPRKLSRQGEFSTATESCDSIQNPFVHFRFLYRSEGALQNLGFIPLRPSPSFTQSETRSQSTTAREEAMEQEIARLRAELEARDDIFRVKQEIKNEESGDNRQPKRIRLTKTDTKIQTIDLTGDD